MHAVTSLALEQLHAEIRERNASSPSPSPLPPPLMTVELIDEEETMIENHYQTNVSIPSHLKWPTKRVSQAADHDLAYLYEGHNAEFELPLLHPKGAGVTDVTDSPYDDPTSLSLTPAPVRVQGSHQKVTQGQCHEGGADSEAKVPLSHPNGRQEITLL